MKKLLFMLIPAMMVLLAGCSDSKDDEPKIVEDANIAWLKSNIVGEWTATHTYNSVSGTWVTTTYGWPNNKFIFSSNGTVEIADFNTLNGSHTYSFTTKDGQAMLKIGDKEIGVLSVDPSSKKFTLFGVAKLVKQ